MDYKKIASEVVAHIGGQENIKGATHLCNKITFNLK